MFKGRITHVAGKAYLHQDDCESALRDGMEVIFRGVHTDPVRGKRFLRASMVDETTRSKLDLLGKGGIELVPQSDDGTGLLVHTSILMSYCIEPQLAVRMKELVVAGNAVRLLVIHWPDGSREFPKRKEVRQLVELKTSLFPVNFSAPGKHHVLAMLVWDRSESFLKDRYLARSNDQYKTDVIGNDGSGIILEEMDANYRNSAIHWFGTGCIGVEVPRELFAEKPLDWGFVNMLYKNPPKDQCDFRRRRFIAYPVGTVVLIVCGILSAFHWLGRLLLATVLFLLGFRGVSFKTLKHFEPEGYLFGMIWNDMGRNRFVPHIQSEGKAIRLPIFLVISPAVLIFIGTVGLVAMLINHMTWLELAYLCGYLFVVVLVCLALITVLTVIHDKIDKAAQEAARKEAKRMKLMREAEQLVCTATGPAKPSVWQLPFGVRNFRFYAFALKQRVCRGFAA